MTDLICRKSMTRCLTPGMCSPHGGCQAEKTEWQSGYDEGRRMGTKHMYAEVDQLKADNEALRKNADRYVWLRDKSENLHGFYLSTPIWMTGVRFSKENVDSTIDAAMGKGEQP